MIVGNTEMVVLKIGAEGSNTCVIKSLIRINHFENIVNNLLSK